MKTTVGELYNDIYELTEIIDIIQSGDSEVDMDVIALHLVKYKGYLMQLKVEA